MEANMLKASRAERPNNIQRVRPVYQKKKHKIAEEQIILQVCAFANKCREAKGELGDLVPYEQKSFSPIDYAFARNARPTGGEKAETVSYVEAKDRYNDLHKYPTVYISAHKWQAGLEVSRFEGKPFLFAFRFQMSEAERQEQISALEKDGLETFIEDRIYLFHVEKTPFELGYKIGMDGNEQRGDGEDRERVVYIPIRHLKPLYARHAVGMHAPLKKESLVDAVIPSPIAATGGPSAQRALA